VLLCTNKILRFYGFNKTQYVENLPTFLTKIWESNFYVKLAMNKYVLCWTRQCNMTCSVEVLLILLHIPFPVYEPSESKCFQVGCWVGGWLIVAANMEIFESVLGVTTNTYHFTISPRSSVTNTRVIFFTPVVPLFLH